jgi:hypothetical protein
MISAANLDRRIEEHWQDQRALYGMDSLRDALKDRQEADAAVDGDERDVAVNTCLVDD